MEAVPSPFVPNKHHALYKVREGLYVQDNCCLVYNTVNAMLGWKNLKLKLVAGSLGIGTTKPFFEYGGLAWKKFSNFSKAGGRVDAHVWLEDEFGNVYDVVTQHIAWVAVVRGKKISLRPRDIIEGKSKEELRKLGLHYVRAEELVGKLIIKKMTRIFV